MTAPAYRADGAEVSRDAFYAVACDPRRSVVVEACAGAGKTWMLVSRILRALLDGAQPQEILAITFTRKAAGEMRDRLDDWLREFGAPGTSDAQRELALRERGMTPAQAAHAAGALGALQRRLLDGGRAVEILTFHAWFAQLLRAAPLELLEELGLHPEAEPMLELDEHLPELMRRFHAALLREPALRADHAALVAQRGRAQARRWFETVLARRVEFELADRAGRLEASVPPAVAPGEPAPVAQLRSAAWQDALRRLAGALAQGGKAARCAADALAEALAHEQPQASFDAAWQALFTTAGTPRKLGAVDGLEAVQRGLEDLAAQSLQHESHAEHLRMVRLSRVLLAEYAAYKRSRGLLDMNDLEHGALALLRDATLAGWVQERLDARIRQMLIDEFQDTSPLQWHALHAWLSAYAGAGGGASGQRAPSVFVVGDPKQSIYRFRRAEPRVFEAVRRFVGEALAGSVLECDHTRRNAPEVLAGVNAVFDAAQRAGQFAGFRDHSTEQPEGAGAAACRLAPVPRPPRARAEAPAADSPWRDSLATPRHEPETLLRSEEAARVAQGVHVLIEQGTPPGGIIVLSRKRESLRLVAQALQARHLPCVAAEDRPLLEAPEALDLIAVLDALASPGHALSLARALRCPLFGADDADLIALAQAAGEGGDWWAALMALEAASPALQRARSLLARWRDAARTLPPHDLLDRIVHEGDWVARLAACVAAPRRAAALAALDAVLAQALALDAGRYVTPYGFVRALKRRALKLAAPAPADAVRLLTVHGAKGLEADVVFVMDADPQPRPAETATLLVDWPVDAAHPCRCAFVYAESRCPPALRPLLDAEREARRREELNGLYVAMTRARRRLVFSATEPSRRVGEEASWWQRIEAVAVPWTPQPPDVPPPAAQGVIRLRVLPEWSAPPAVARAARVDTEATRLGQAVHRVLEWVGGGAGDALPRLAAAAAAEFGAEAQAVQARAAAMLANPACTRLFGGPALRWAGNEVPVSLDGEVLRIDRLVLLEEDDGPVWWVLDYKLHQRPQDLPAYREQLARYRAAVELAQPGARVRAALVAGDGSVVEPG